MAYCRLVENQVVWKMETGFGWGMLEVRQLTLAVVGNMELCGCLTKGMQEGKIILGELSLQVTQFVAQGHSGRG